MKTVLTMLAAALVGGAAFAAEPGFAVTPKVEKTGDTVKITFTVSAATDVAVSILDAKGKVVRHLAAGVLGSNAPAPLKADSLAQEIVWDGKDDLGRPAGDGPFRVRVAAGLKPTFRKLIGYNPADIYFGYHYPVRALATGPKGEVYVFHVFGNVHPLDGTLACTVFSRKGEYLRQVMPYPANLPEEKLTGLKRIDIGGGVKVPFIYQAETRSLVPGAGDLPNCRAVATKDGRVAFVGIQEGPKRYSQAGKAQLVILNADGSTPPEGVLGTVISERSSSGASLALSPDEKTFYAAGLREGSYAGKPTHAVYKFGWYDKAPTVFAGEKAVSGDDEKHLNTPKDVAVDKDGNVYVADKGNNRIAVFGADGGFLGKLDVENPVQIEVHRRTGAMYVVGGKRQNILRKFASWKTPKPVAEITLPYFGHRGYTVVTALDDSTDPPVLWHGSWQGGYGRPRRFILLRIEDKGDAFGEPTDPVLEAHQKSPSVGSVLDLSVNRELGLLYFRGRAWDLAAGKFVGPARGIKTRGCSAGLDGKFYSYAYPARIFRYSGLLEPLPFETGADKKGALPSSLHGDTRLRGRGVTADARGNVYVLWEKRGKDDIKPGDAGDANTLYSYGPDGKLKKADLIDAQIRSLNCVRVDYAGNIYLALGLRPGTDLLPPHLKGRFPEAKKDPDAVGGVNSYPMIYGSIAKFPPTGGVIRKDAGGVKCNYAFGTPVEVKGARWIFSGASNVPSWRTPGTPDICLCESPVFDVDGFGRSFFPDAGCFRVGVIDTNGNLICWFGAYGNQDSAGPDSAIPTPAIALAWPQAVAVTDRAAYIGDRLNRRIVAVNLSYAAEEICPIP